MRNLLLLGSIVYCAACFGQSRNNNWMIGEDVQLDFGDTPPDTSGSFQLADGPYRSCISDTAGVLAFSFDGKDFYDRFHAPMPGGSGDGLWDPTWCD
ncbi:MAG: hypothetical protein IPO12_16180 [Flavobacteriales bacterium]|nr:hypothetical protein [Flavobacteriales bacterium]